MSVHNDAVYIDAAVQSVLRQTLPDFELLVVDDASTDGTSERLAAYDDSRVRVERNVERSGLAVSLNRGLELAQGRYLARLDADDVALPERLEEQVAHIRSDSRLAVVGSAVHDLDEHGATGKLHRSPLGRTGVRWVALFSSPFFHPTVLVDRERLAELGLRYDTSFEESEDYDLWTRLLRNADGANVRRALVLKRLHPGQASRRRGDVQQAFQQQVALREIERIAPDVDAARAWRVGARKQGGSRKEFVALLRSFQLEHGRDREVIGAAIRALLSPRRRGA